MSSRWAAPRRCASTCSTMKSRPSGASTRRRSARSMPCRRVRLLPAREVPLDAQAVKDFRRRYRTRFEGDPTKSAIYRGVSEGLAPAGVEFYQPLFFDSTATLLDYLPADTVHRQRRGAGAHARARLERGRRPLRGAAPRHRAPGARAGGAVRAPAGAARRSRALRGRDARCLQGGHRAAAAHPPGCATSRPARRASCGSTCAPSNRSHRSMRSSRPSTGAC